MRQKSNITCVLVLCLSSAPALAAVQYTFTDLGTLEGSETHAWQINNAGQIVGTSRLADGSDRAFLYENGTMRNLGVLGEAPPGFPWYGETYSLAGAINENGVVVGLSSSSEGDRIFTFTSDGPMQPVETGVSWIGVPFDINNNGQIVGTEGWGSSPRGFVTSGGSTLDLSTILGAPCTVIAINERGQVVGQGPAGRAYVYDTTTGAVQYLDVFSEARSINEQGDVVGFSSLSLSYPNGWVWRGGQLQPLGQFAPDAINNHGLIVGTIVGTAQYPTVRRAALYDGSNLIDLNTLIDPSLGWVLNFAWDINDLGQIAGTGTYNGQYRAFLLTPIPEPSTMLLLVLGSAALLIRRR